MGPGPRGQSPSFPDRGSGGSRCRSTRPPRPRDACFIWTGTRWRRSCSCPTESGPAAHRSIFPGNAVSGLRRTDSRGKETPVSATVLYMSMSLDGFIAGPNERPDNGLGDGGERLPDWFLTGGAADGIEAIPRLGAFNGRGIDEAMAPRAVVAGPGALEPAGGSDRDHPRH